LVKEKKMAEAIYSGDLKYPCPDCDMSFGTKEERMEHSKVHNK
jgi:hypothetical protein